MLKQSELEQIREIMREVIITEVKNGNEQISSEVTMSRLHVQKDIFKLEKRVKGIEVKMEKGFSSLKSDIDTAIEVFNRDDTKLAKRVQTIEDHLNLPSQ